MRAIRTKSSSPKKQRRPGEASLQKSRLFFQNFLLRLSAIESFNVVGGVVVDEVEQPAAVCHVRAQCHPGNRRIEVGGGFNEIGSSRCAAKVKLNVSIAQKCRARDVGGTRCRCHHQVHIAAADLDRCRGAGDQSAAGDGDRIASRTGDAAAGLLDDLVSARA